MAVSLARRFKALRDKRERQKITIEKLVRKKLQGAFLVSDMKLQYKWEGTDRYIYSFPEIRRVHVKQSDMLTKEEDKDNLTTYNSICTVTIVLRNGMTYKKLEDSLDTIKQVFNCKYMQLNQVTPREIELSIRYRDLPKKISFDFEKIRKMVKGRKIKIPIVFGYTQEGNLIIGDMKTHPHLGVGASTGSGKSALYHTILNSLIMLNLDIEYHLADLKGNELTMYEDVKRVKEIYTNTDDILIMLSRLANLVKERYAILRRYGASTITDISQEHRDIINLETNMKTKLIVIDETGMLDGKGEMKEKLDKIFLLLREITALGRGCEIYVIVSAQRLDSTVLPGFVKNNLMMTVALAMANETSARTTIKGASFLEGAGRALVKFGTKVHEVQVPFVEVPEIKRNIKPFERVRERGLLPHEEILLKLNKKAEYESYSGTVIADKVTFDESFNRKDITPETPSINEPTPDIGNETERQPQPTNPTRPNKMDFTEMYKDLNLTDDDEESAPPKKRKMKGETERTRAVDRNINSD